jgi:hypothetical protein
LKHFKPAVLLEILLHLLFWAFITFLPFFSGPQRRFIPFSHVLLINTLLAVQFYLNAFVLIPFVLNNGKQPALYFLLLAFSFTAASFIIVYTRPEPEFFQRMHPQFPGPPPAGRWFFLPLVAITAASFAYRYLTDHFRQARKRNDIRNAALTSELAFLRSQISPHFMFNVINSVVALSRLKPAAVEPTLIQLSQLLRYMLYISDEEKINMGKKAEYLDSYIQLQKLRFGANVNIDYLAHIGSPEKTLEPMLLIPFVENAFKHGISDVEHPAIQVSLVANEKTLDFRVSNNYNPEDENSDEYHGIGLANVKRRLELLYPGKHRLSIMPDSNTYNVHLQLQFH